MNFFGELYNKLLNNTKYDFSPTKKPLEDDKRSCRGFRVSDFKYIAFWVFVVRKEKQIQIRLDFLRNGKPLFENNFKKIKESYSNILKYYRELDKKKFDIPKYFDIDVDSEDFVEKGSDLTADYMIQMLDILKDLNLE